MTLKLNERDHVQGPAAAAVTLVEYGDYECPYCGQAASIVKRLQDTVGDGLRFAFRQFPLQELHAHALHAAEVAEAAAVQGKFWDMHDALFEHQDSLEDRALLTYAGSLGLDIEALTKDATGTVVQRRLRSDLSSGIRNGVRGTPSFFINGEPLEGGWDYESLLAAIRSR
jgi:protein-disulfide isomerase